MEIITTMYVKQYIKGVYTLYPTEAQYVGIWDTAQVFDFVRKPQYSPKEDIDLMMLSKKLGFFLIVIITGQCSQIITNWVS